ncbi:MAG: hypothetical protein IT199_07105, partial [Solirubrobacterales bacterium]|nr:hypothetical protein [Solirubrobacterales bacterium]
MDTRTPDDQPQAHHSVRLIDVVWLAAAGAVFAALTSAVIAEFRFRVLRTLTWTSRDFAWLAWAGNMVFFLLPVPLVALVYAIGRRRLGLSFAATLFGSLA